MSEKKQQDEKPSSKILVNLVKEDRILEVKSLDRLKQVLNIDPPEQWVKDHPYAKNVKYLPIDKVELLLDTIFQAWRVEVKSLNQLAQSIVCVVRVHYKDPVTGEWSYHDGVGAVPLKTDAGFSAADLSHIKSDAVQAGAPSAKSFAIKDAAEHLGKIFGKDLNRKDTTGFVGVYDDGEEIEPRRSEPKDSARSSLEFEYAQLRSRLYKVDLISAVDEARNLSDDDVKNAIESMKKKEEENNNKDEAKSEMQKENEEDWSRDYSEKQSQLQFERMTGAAPHERFSV